MRKARPFSGVPHRLRTTLIAATMLALVFSIIIGTANAGITGQPNVTANDASDIRAAVSDIAAGRDVGAARPKLYLVVEKSVIADIVPFLERALGDDITFNGLTDIFDEAMQKKSAAESRFARYNLAYLYLLRSHYLRQGAARDRFLLMGARIVEPLTVGNNRDAAALNLSGDLYIEASDLNRALAEYGKMQSVVGAEIDHASVKAFAPYKIALAYQHTNRFDFAKSSYDTAIRADASSGNGGHKLLHLIYQGLASLYLQQGNDPAALQALALSAHVTAEVEHPFSPRTDVARQLLQRGHNREVAAYTAAALKISPQDRYLLALQSEAQSAVK